MRVPPVPRLWGPGIPRTPYAKHMGLDGQSLADYFLTSSHNDSQKSSFQSSSRHVLFVPLFSRKPPTEAKTARNSLSWKILQGTSLFSIFCSATLPVTQRQQGFYAQSMAGGTRSCMAVGFQLSEFTSSRAAVPLRGAIKLSARQAMANFSRSSSLRICPRAWSAQGPLLSSRA